MKSLVELYQLHQGKVSDKWEIYLREYDRLFSPYRDRPIRLLEIGIQNGGSLEIWSQYFAKGEKFVGCDINPNCGKLSYKDPRIALVIGDANSDETQAKVISLSDQFDLVVDDGSHTSGDIVRSFARYFFNLKEGGLYIAEDLHCSYWQELDGGLYHPYSSMSFFKRLVDVINQEHWQIDKTKMQFLSGIKTHFSVDYSEELLSQIHSIEFINSICVIRKESSRLNTLGERLFAGQQDNVVLMGQFAPPVQASNKWSALERSPEESFEQLSKDFTERVAQIDERDAQIADRGAQIAERDAQIAERDAQIAERVAQIAERDAQIAERVAQIAERVAQIDERDAQIVERDIRVAAILNSTSWRLASPVRLVGKSFNQVGRIFFLLRTIFTNLKEIKNVTHKLRKTGFGYAEYQLKLLQSQEYASQVARNRGISPEFLNALIAFGTKFFQFRQWLANNLFGKYSGSLAAFLRGETGSVSNNVLKHIRVHIDTPNKIFKIVDNSFTITGWCIDLNACAFAKTRVRIGKVVHQPYQARREEVSLMFASVCALPKDVGFVCNPLIQTGLHRMWIDIQCADGTWIPVRRTFLLSMPLLFGGTRQSSAYKAWLRIDQKQLKAELTEIKRHIDVMIHKPIFTIVIDMRRSHDGWEKSLKSVQGQIYPHHELHILVNIGVELPGDLKNGAKLLKEGDPLDVLGDFIIFLEGGQRLSINALYEFAGVLNQNPDLDLVYGDEDCLSSGGRRCAPFFKPDWSPDYLETFNYIGFPTCFRTTIANRLPAYANAYDYVLRFTERSTKIFHIAKILGHKSIRKVDEVTLSRAAAANIAALQGRLNRTGRHGTVREHELYRGCYDIELNLKQRPLVSIIIPTAGKFITVNGYQVDLITNLIIQIRDRSNYKNIEIIVIDNGNLTEGQRQVIEQQGCQRITYTEPVFNISKKLNLGASIANGELLLLMNDDIEIPIASWIERMVEQFEKPHIGVVGAKLLYPDGRTQHVGVVHNYGEPHHVRRFFPGDEAGYYYSTCGVHNFMAVTGAVMMTTLKIFRELGGYSEELATNFNDIDYCLKVQDKGYYVAYVPRAALTHMESQSHVVINEVNEITWYQKRWAHKIVSDPYYNEQFLAVMPPTFMPHFKL